MAKMWDLYTKYRTHFWKVIIKTCEVVIIDFTHVCWRTFDA